MVGTSNKLIPEMNVEQTWIFPFALVALRTERWSYRTLGGGGAAENQERRSNLPSGEQT